MPENCFQNFWLQLWSAKLSSLLQVSHSGAGQAHGCSHLGPVRVQPGGVGDILEVVEKGVESGTDVPESWTEAREVVLLQGDQADQVGEPELLLGRGHHRYTAPYEQDQKKDQRIHNWWI